MEKQTFVVRYQPYERFGDGRFRTRRFKATDNYSALRHVVDYHGYGWDDDEGKPTFDQLLEKFEQQNGDGCDYVFFFANDSTKDVLINEMVADDEVVEVE